MADDNPRVHVGANNPPSPTEPFVTRIAALYLAVNELPGELTDENAPLFRDELAKATTLAKDIEHGRKVEKQPHLDAAGNVDALFRPLGEQVAKIADSVRARLTEWARAEERRRREEAIEAESRRQEAEAAAQAAAEGAQDDPFAARDAVEAQQSAALAGLDADRAAKRAAAAPSVGSASGFRAGSLRTSRKARVTDAAAMVAHFAQHPSVIAEAEKLANAQIRAAKGGPVNIPGVEVVEEKSFV